MIPKIIHQTWINSNIPESFQHWQKSWGKMNPDFKYILWTNEDIEDLINEQDFEIKNLFYSYKNNICRIDLARYLILNKFGGLYVDIDFECLKPHHKLLSGHQLMMGLEPDTHSNYKKTVSSGIRTIVCNAWMASEPKHPFWSHLLSHLLSSQFNSDVLEITGPFALTRAIASYGGKDISIIPSKYIYPIDKNACWSGQVQDLEFFDNNTRDSLALHHWVGSWFRPSDYLSRLPLPIAKAFVRTATSSENSARPLNSTGLFEFEKSKNVDVSCLMVTRGNPHRIRHCIRSFLKQSIVSKELVIVTDVKSENLSFVRAEFSDENIKWVFSDPEKKLSLGELRNLSIDSASGFYVAQWDDDDMFDPSRLEHQIDVIKKSKSAACMLSRWTVWWPSKKRLFISGKRSWEGSLVCERSLIPRYPSLSKAEDTVLIKELLSTNNVVFLDAPRLYIYVIHGENTWHEAHFDGLFNKASYQFQNSSYHKILNEISKRVDVEKYFKTSRNYTSN